MNKLSNPQQLIKVFPPEKRDIYTIRAMISCAAITMLLFIVWFINPEHVGYAPIFWLLTFALFFKLVKMVHEWYHYWSPSIPVPPKVTKQWKVDVLTTACPGEPREMIINTMRAMVNISYPHTNYLCDEGDDPELKAVCETLGVIHVTRKIKIDAKAGNINNALKQATGEICIVLDPDHIPVPEFIDRVLPYFEDDKIGFVQCVQAYGNQSESIIALGAAEQTYHFYGPMMMTMNTYGTAQAIGANCTFRRSALDSIGGHAAGLSEDMHTAMQLHAKGWKSVYIPEILTRGLVPATLSAYYKQQLKWSRGTFELLFRTFPKLRKNFTWRQKIHYFTIPLYFLFGLINLIDLVVPAAALCLAEVPWAIDLGRFAFLFFPLCAFSLVIRLFAQRWLLEKHERGFHIAGGIVRCATWWIFLIGFIYTIFKIKVPYIPTPKEDKHENYWLLSLPNFVVVLITFATVYYGLKLDWTPYSLAMAFYALLTSVMLLYVILMSQQKMINSLNAVTSKVPGAGKFSYVIRAIRENSNGLAYGAFRNGTLGIIVIFSLLFLSYKNINEPMNKNGFTQEKDFGGFYTGIHTTGNLDETPDLFQKLTGKPVSVVAMDYEWRVDSLPFLELLTNADRGKIPLINWQVNAFSSDIMSEIKKGSYDNYLKSCAATLRSFSKPVFIAFAPGFDNGHNKYSPEEFILAWQYAYTFFNNLGISNITWVWNPSTAKAASYYPGPKFVDWIGIPVLNYAAETKAPDWYSFSQIYKPYRVVYGQFQKPVMITEFGSVVSHNRSKWFQAAFKDINSDFKEIKSLIFYNDKKTFTIVQDNDTIQYNSDFRVNDSETRQLLAEELSSSIFNKTPLIKTSYQALQPQLSYQSKFVKGAAGQFTLEIDRRPYYIRGVAYNTAHDWRDGNMPLTRKQVEKDLQHIKQMGANTIRRYDHGIYDQNVLNIANEVGLKVQYGFWFDPMVDFYSDTIRVQEYMEQVEEKILEYKDHPSILAWSLGNETWGLLKHNYAKPYLTNVRAAYVKMIEKLAQRIHELDPSRPVFASMEHEEYQLPGELVAFRDGAPSLDVIGVNSYYREQISTLNHVTWEFDSLRPYLISEFGPRGYWDPTYNRTKNNSLIEDSESEKAEWYKYQWQNYVLAFKGYNIGGFAYCWHDRMEGTYTWFGLTDFKGRLKPSYYALKELWTNENQNLIPDFQIEGPQKVVAGKSYKFTALGPNKFSGALGYEWYLLKNEYLEKVDLEYSENSTSVVVEVPYEKSDYRLYLYVTDATGNVTTASAPIRVN